MKTLFFCLVWLFCQPVFAAEEQKDTFDDGANAFVAGNYDEAERILKLHAKEQPSAVYLLRLIKALRKEKKNRYAVLSRFSGTPLQRRNRHVGQAGHYSAPQRRFVRHRGKHVFEHADRQRETRRYCRQI